MILKYIERGMRIYLRMASASSDSDGEYTAIFHDMHDLVNETSFVAKSSELSNSFNTLDRNAVMEVSFSNGPSIYSFNGRVIGKTRNDMVIIERLTDIEILNRRAFQRDEIRVEVRIYALSEDMISMPKYSRPWEAPLMADMSFDVSSGGICIITNKALNEKHDPYYLIEFALSDRDSFLLPAKLVRRSNYARSKIGKYDYGFQFLFDQIPDEMSRLTKAILSKKLSFYRS